MIKGLVLVDQSTYKTDADAIEAVTKWLTYDDVTVHVVKRDGSVFADCWRPERRLEAIA